MPEDGYGWEKLFSERMCRHFLRGLRPRRRGSPATTTSTARTAPGTAAARRRRPRSAARSPTAALTGEHEIEIWGDGKQTRSFMYIDDCVHGTQMITDGDDPEPVNLGSDELVTINELVDIVEEIAGVTLERAATSSTRRRACAAATATTPRSCAGYGWAPSTSLATVSSAPTRGSTTR